MNQPANNIFPLINAKVEKLWTERSLADAPLPYLDPPGTAPSPSSTLTTAYSLERRLPRRAELTWEQLASDDSRPAAVESSLFLQGAYADNAMLLRRQPEGALTLDSIGASLQDITQMCTGHIAPNAIMRSELGEQLLHLGLAALDATSPLRLETGRMAQYARAGSPQLVLRAIALPFEADTNGDSVAIVIATWRKLLSAEETAALHRELEAAMSWMQKQRFKD